MEHMPPDPFMPDDMANFGQGAYSFYASLKAAGFTEGQAIEMTKAIVVSMITTAMTMKPPVK